VEQLKDPFTTDRDDSPYTRPPIENEKVQRTFCGT